MRYLSLLLTLVLMAGCGSKGPLFLPEEETGAKQPAASPDVESEPFPEPAQEQEDEDDVNL